MVTGAIRSQPQFEEKGTVWQMQQEIRKFECRQLMPLGVSFARLTRVELMGGHFNCFTTDVIHNEVIMSDLVNELRQHALMCANEIKRLNPEKSDEVEKAYGRVKTFAGNICPTCWVKDEKSSALEIEAHTNDVNYYRCRQCGFSGAFPKNSQPT